MKSSDRTSGELMSSSVEHAANCDMSVILSITVMVVSLYQRDVYHEVEEPYHDNGRFRSASENPSLVMWGSANFFQHEIGILVPTIGSRYVQERDGNCIHPISRPREGIVKILESVGIIRRSCCCLGALAPKCTPPQDRDNREKADFVECEGICKTYIIDTGERLKLADNCDQNNCEKLLQPGIQNSALNGTGKEDRFAKNKSVRLAPAEDNIEDRISVCHQKFRPDPYEVNLWHVVSTRIQ